MKITKFAIAVLITSFSPLALATMGPYIKGEAGGVVISNNASNTFKANNPAGGAGRISLGNLCGNKNFNYGLEAGAQFYDAKTNFLFFDASYKGYNLDLLGVLQYAFNSGWVLFAKGGAAYLHQKATFEVFDISVTKTGSKIAPELAVGAGYQFTPNVELDLTEYTVFAGGPDRNNNNPTAMTSSLLLGLTYHFG